MATGVPSPELCFPMLLVAVGLGRGKIQGLLVEGCCSPPGERWAEDPRSIWEWSWQEMLKEKKGVRDTKGESQVSPFRLQEGWG